MILIFSGFNKRYKYINNILLDKFPGSSIVIQKDFKGDQEMHTTGFHKHMVDFQMYYVLKGWVKFIYDGEGELTFNKGDCVMAPAAIKHNEISCSDDFEALEILSPAKHETVKV